MVERQTVNLYVVGSIPTGAVYNGVSPSGKAQDFDSCITLVQIQLPQFCRYSLVVKQEICNLLSSVRFWMSAFTEYSSVGRMLDLGSRGRTFESCYSDLDL